MKVTIIAENTDLKKYFPDDFQVTFGESFNNIDSDVAIIGSKLVDLDSLKVLNHLPKYTFYLMEHEVEEKILKRIKTVCDSNNLIFISPGLTDEQIYQFIKTTISPEKKDDSNVITFFSTISNVGTTSITLSTAASIAQRTSLNIAVLCLNAWDDGTDYFESYSGKYLSDIISDLSNQVYDFDKPTRYSEDPFIKNMHYVKSGENGFYVLAGNSSVKLERAYGLEEIDYLITLAKNKFDLVLIDAGSHFDNALIYQSLYHANLKLLVTNQQQKAVRKFVHYYNHVLEISGFQKDDFLLVINQYINEGGLPKHKDISESFGVDWLTVIPHIDYLGIKSEQVGRILYFYEVDEYNNEINRIANSISGTLDLKLDFSDDKEEKKSLISLWKARK